MREDFPKRSQNLPKRSQIFPKKFQRPWDFFFALTFASDLEIQRSLRLYVL